MFQFYLFFLMVISRQNLLPFLLIFKNLIGLYSASVLVNKFAEGDCDFLYICATQ